MTKRHLEGIREKIADLRRMEATLVEMSAQCEGGNVPHCPIIYALHEAD